MSRKLAIIGIGHVGSTIAHQIVAGGLADDLVLIDTNEAKVQADALDFEDAMANLPWHTNIFVNDYSQLKDTDVIISSLGKISLQNNKNDDRFAELPFTSKEVIGVANEIKNAGFNGRIITITNPCDVITSIYQQVTGLPKNHVMGTGTLLDSSRMKRSVAKSLKIDPRSVVGYNLGEHGNSQFTAWSTVRVLGKPILDFVEENHLDLKAINEATKHGGYTVFRGKGYTNYGIASAAVHLYSVIISDALTELPVSNYHAEYDSYLSYPAIVGRDGIVSQLQLDLTKEERDKLQVSADFIKSKYRETMKVD